MSLLTPLGLLGLLGLVALIIIYIIKPIFQNKIISSTYVWKRSLRYRKKKIPISQLRNILIFICQVLIITAIAAILAQPYIDDEDAHNGDSTVIIIDASASMLAESGGFTRFERAVNQVSEKVDEIFKSENASVSIILATNKPDFIEREAKADSILSVKKSLNDLLYESEENENVCTYGKPDIPSAIKLAEEITAYNANSNVILYTDTEYIDKDNVEVVKVCGPSDWNAAVLDVRAKIVENFYVFEVDVASFGEDRQIEVNCSFFGVNDQQENLPPFTKNVKCISDSVQTIVFSVQAPTEGTDESLYQQVGIYEYNYLHVSINEHDSLSEDNNFSLFGGKRPTLRVQYKSTLPNNFYASALMVLRDRLGDYWDIDIDECKKGDDQYATEGYDIYIFEHMVPSTIPSDGIVILSDPGSLPSRLGIQLGKTYQSSNKQLMPLENAETHPVTSNINAENIGVTRYTAISNYDDYTPLLSCQNSVIAAVKNTEDQKLVVMSFSMNYSNLALLPEFPLFMYNLVNYFTPMTFDGFVFDVNSSVDLNARADVLNISGPGAPRPPVKEFPHNLPLTLPGTYTVSQDLISGETVHESFFVKIPAEESNINLVVDSLENPYFYQEPEGNNIDLLFYFALALVALLFIEWWLKSREQA